VAAEDPNGLYSEILTSDPRGTIVRSEPLGAYAYAVKPQMADKPVNFVSWLDAARFANWLENGGTATPGSTEQGAFDLSVADPRLNAVAAQNATWSLPTEKEWYKAAYYDPATGYSIYPTGEDIQPVPALANAAGDVSNPTQSAANYASAAVWNGQQGNVTTVGSAGSTTEYGNSDMGGNVGEWLADDSDLGNRKARGGGFADTRLALESTAPDGDRNRDSSYEGPDVGVRLVLVPEPSALLLGIAALITVQRVRRKPRSGLAPRATGPPQNERCYSPAMASDDRASRASAHSRVIRPGTAAADRIEQDDAAYWRQLSPSERFLLALRLSLEQWRLNGWDPRDRGRPSRSVESVHRP
jgi:hypothetical protein